jgi:hypothetical protein
MRQAFPAHLYRRRALIQSLVSTVKRKLSAQAPSRSLATQCLQALLLGIAYHIYRLWYSPVFRNRRMSTESDSFMGFLLISIPLIFAC